VSSKPERGGHRAFGHFQHVFHLGDVVVIGHELHFSPPTVLNRGSEGESLKLAFRAVSVATLLAATVSATTITYQVPGEASAVITTGANTVSLTLSDLVINPTSAADNLSAFSFTLSGSPGALSITGFTDETLEISNGGSYSIGAQVDPGWSLTTVGAMTDLDVLIGPGHAGPSQTIIGAPDNSNLYSNANGSLLNGAHNPFLNESVTWTFSASGVTAGTTVTGVSFQFGTTNGVGVIPGVQAATPEPASIALMFGGCGLLAIAKRKKLTNSLRVKM
jgi:hypothetical protein